MANSDIEMADRNTERTQNINVTVKKNSSCYSVCVCCLCTFFIIIIASVVVYVVEEL